MTPRLSTLALVWLLSLAPCGAMPTALHDPATPEASATTARGDRSAATASAEGALTLSANGWTSSLPLTLPPLSSSTPAGGTTTGRSDAMASPSMPTEAVTSPTTTPLVSTETRGAMSEATSTTAAATSATTSPPVWTTVYVSTATTPNARSTSVGPPKATPPAVKTATSPPRKRGNLVAGANHGVVVAWVIGGALLLMMLAFLVIYVKKRKLVEEQTTAKNWAGPSPFIEGGDCDAQEKPRPSNRISISSFLPQRRKLSLLPEADEEMEDINPGTTFGDRRRAAPGNVGKGTGAAPPPEEAGNPKEDEV